MYQCERAGALNSFPNIPGYLLLSTHSVASAPTKVEEAEGCEKEMRNTDRTIRQQECGG